MDEAIEFMKDVFWYIVIIIIVILAKVYVLSALEVVGTSMEPNLRDKNLVMYEKVSNYFVGYKRFDVVIFRYDMPPYVIKRIIGLPGEKIEYIDGKLLVNDEDIGELFEIKGRTSDFSITQLGYGVIPDNMYFVLGDNRSESIDSRTMGLIPREDIVGKPFLVIWPFNQVKFVKGL
jgi:signal peptidase I